MIHPRPLDSSTAHSTHAISSAGLAPGPGGPGSMQAKIPARAERLSREIAMPTTTTTTTQMKKTMMQQPRRGFRPRRPITTSSSLISFNSSSSSSSNSKAAAFSLRPPRAAGTATVPLTVSDAELASRGFAVRRTAEGIDVAALNEVFARVGFPRRDEGRLRRALDHSRVVWLSAAGAGAGAGEGEEEEATRPVAFARAAGDGVFNAVVWDVVVEPSCQGLGLGRAVMERLVDELRRDGVANIVLYAEPRVVGFYRLLDFAMDPDGIRGMAYYRKSATITGASNTA